MTPPDLPEWSFVRTVEPSPHAPGTLYLAATRYKLDDPAPYLYRTADYGGSWQAITGSGDLAIPADDFTRVIRADPHCPGVLYAGTETGLHVSLDDGATWRHWRSNFPVTPVYDLKVEGADLVVATHGRSFWILDDLTPLHQEASGTGGGLGSDPESGTVPVSGTTGLGSGADSDGDAGPDRGPGSGSGSDPNLGLPPPLPAATPSRTPASPPVPIPRRSGCMPPDVPGGCCRT